MSDFGKKMVIIRKSLGFSRVHAAECAGMSEEALRKIEKGKSLPRIDTLYLLSQIYKVDLLKVIQNSMNAVDLERLVELIDRAIATDDVEKVNETIHHLEQMLNKNHFDQLIDNKELQQIKIYYQGMMSHYSFDDDYLERSYKQLIHAIQVTNPLFTIERWRAFYYTPIEIRILLSLSFVMIDLKQYNDTVEILKYVNLNLDLLNLERVQDIRFRIRINALLSYVWHKLNDYDQSLKYAEVGIDQAMEGNVMDNLPLLLSRKGVALYHLDNPYYTRYLIQSVHLLEIQNKYDKARQYRSINRKYGIE